MLFILRACDVCVPHGSVVPFIICHICRNDLEENERSMICTFVVGTKVDVIVKEKKVV